MNEKEPQKTVGARIGRAVGTVIYFPPVIIRALFVATRDILRFSWVAVRTLNSTRKVKLDFFSKSNDGNPLRYSEKRKNTIRFEAFKDFYGLN